LAVNVRQVGALAKADVAKLRRFAANYKAAAEYAAKN
jgi:hypothetical protein